jgi:hypothetical protein
MHRKLTAAALAALMAFAAGSALAKPHPEWHQGARIASTDWAAASISTTARTICVSRRQATNGVKSTATTSSPPPPPA